MNIKRVVGVVLLAGAVALPAWALKVDMSMCERSVDELVKQREDRLAALETRIAAGQGTREQYAGAISATTAEVAALKSADGEVYRAEKCEKLKAMVRDWPGKAR